MTYRYDQSFFDYIEVGARRSAEVVIGSALRDLEPGSVLDVGCGRGAWLAEWQAHGVNDFLGIDGDYVDCDRLTIPKQRFHAANLTTPVNIPRRFDLVQCLEVGEHLPPPSSATLVASLCAHGDMIVFSAAVPGQGGEHHINEKPLESWRALFAQHGYATFDPFRRKLAKMSSIEPWYRYNILLYANPYGEARLPREIAATRIPDRFPIENMGDLTWRIRCTIVSQLPRPIVTLIARQRAALLNRLATWAERAK